jgi:hypothetical protein
MKSIFLLFIVTTLAISCAASPKNPEDSYSLNLYPTELINLQKGIYFEHRISYTLTNSKGAKVNLEAENDVQLHLHNSALPENISLKKVDNSNAPYIIYGTPSRSGTHKFTLQFKTWFQIEGKEYHLYNNYLGKSEFSTLKDFTVEVR